MLHGPLKKKIEEKKDKHVHANRKHWLEGTFIASERLLMKRSLCVVFTSNDFSHLSFDALQFTLNLDSKPECHCGIEILSHWHSKYLRA